MSVAIDFDAEFASGFAPDFATDFRDAGPIRLATVTVLHRPAQRSVAPVLRLTRRGVVVLAAAVAVLAVALVGIAWLSSPAPAKQGSPTATADVVAVRAGDTLWSIATRVAPQRDPRAEVALLQRLNGLTSPALLPGQVLRTH